VKKLRKELATSHAMMHLNYVLKLPRNVMDAIREIIPFLFTLAIR
jgi:hypothetical protein